MMRLEKQLLDLEMISYELNYWMTMTGMYVLQSLCLETIDTVSIIWIGFLTTRGRGILFMKTQGND